MIVNLCALVFLVGVAVNHGEVLFEDECKFRSNLWSCSDCDKCTSLDQCTMEDAYYRAGYYCNVWPFFNRVAPPEAEFYSPIETKTITCSAYNQTGCTMWEEAKISTEELASTTCTCSSYLTTDNRDYCEAWTCTGIGVQKCKSGQYNCGGYSSYGSISWDTSCCYETCTTRKDSNGNSYTTCTPHVYNKPVHDEYQNCVCTNPQVGELSTNGVTYYCDNWECIDYGESSTGKTIYSETEKHECEKRATEGHCEIWNWATDSRRDFENTQCTCDITAATNGSFVACHEFNCKEKGSAKIAPNLAWSSFGLVFFFILFFVLYAVDMSRYSDSWVRALWLVFFINLVIVIPLLLGGLGAIFFVLVIGAPLIGLFLTFATELDIYKKNIFMAPATATASDVSVAPEPPKDIHLVQAVQMVQQTLPQQPMQYSQPGQQPMMMQPQQPMMMQPQQPMQYGQPDQQPMMMQPQQPMQYSQPGQQPMMMQPQQPMMMQPQQPMQYGQPDQQPMMMQPQQPMQYSQPGQQPMMMQPE